MQTLRVQWPSSRMQTARASKASSSGIKRPQWSLNMTSGPTTAFGGSQARQSIMNHLYKFQRATSWRCFMMNSSIRVRAFSLRITTWMIMVRSLAKLSHPTSLATNCARLASRQHRADGSNRSTTTTSEMRWALALIWKRPTRIDRRSFAISDIHSTQASSLVMRASQVYSKRPRNSQFCNPLAWRFKAPSKCIAGLSTTRPPYTSGSFKPAGTRSGLTTSSAAQAPMHGSSQTARTPPVMMINASGALTERRDTIFWDRITCK